MVVDCVRWWCALNVHITIAKNSQRSSRCVTDSAASRELPGSLIFGSWSLRRHRFGISLKCSLRRLKRAGIKPYDLLIDWLAWAPVPPRPIER